MYSYDFCPVPRSPCDRASRSAGASLRGDRIRGPNPAWHSFVLSPLRLRSGQTSMSLRTGVSTYNGIFTTLLFLQPGSQPPLLYL